MDGFTPPTLWQLSNYNVLFPELPQRIFLSKPPPPLLSLSKQPPLLSKQPPLLPKQPPPLLSLSKQPPLLSKQSDLLSKQPAFSSRPTAEFPEPPESSSKPPALLELAPHPTSAFRQSVCNDKTAANLVPDEPMPSRPSCTRARGHILASGKGFLCV